MSLIQTVCGCTIDTSLGIGEQELGCVAHTVDTWRSVAGVAEDLVLLHWMDVGTGGIGRQSLRVRRVRRVMWPLAALRNVRGLR